MPQKMDSTRGNLVQARKSFSAARSGKDLLEQKRQVLMMELVRQIQAARRIQQELSRVFETAYRLAVTARRTHRRVNALEKVVIPFYEQTMAFIDSVLEEQEREARLRAVRKPAPAF